MLKRIFVLLLSTIVLINSTFIPLANAQQPTKKAVVKPVEVKGTEPFRIKTDIEYKFKLDGWYFNDKAEQKIRFRLIQADYFETEIKLLKENQEHFKRMMELEKQIAERYHVAWKESDENLTKVLKREGRTKIWYLLLGIGLTVGAGFAMSQAGR